jgi:hypothetical protein
VIDAWLKSSESNAAMRAAEVLRKLVKRDNVDPDTFSFNQVLSALSRSSIKGATRMAEELLVYMEDAYQSGASQPSPIWELHGDWRIARGERTAERAQELKSSAVQFGAEKSETEPRVTMR